MKNPGLKDLVTKIGGKIKELFAPPAPPPVPIPIPIRR